MKGFTLVELMIMVAVLSIMAAIAIPSVLYHNATVQLRQALTDLHPVEQDLTTFQGPCAGVPSSLSALPEYDYQLNTNLMCTLGARYYKQGMSYGQYISALTLNGQVLSATMGGNSNMLLAGGTLTVTAPSQVGGVWQCAWTANSSHQPFLIGSCP